MSIKKLRKFSQSHKTEIIQNFYISGTDQGHLINKIKKKKKNVIFTLKQESLQYFYVYLKFTSLYFYQSIFYYLYILVCLYFSAFQNTFFILNQPFLIFYIRIFFIRIIRINFLISSDISNPPFFFNDELTFF